MLSHPAHIWYVGAPKYGKTFRAQTDCTRLVALTNLPALVIDSAGAMTDTGLELSTPEQAINSVWGSERRSARVIPRDRKEAESIFSAAYSGGSVILLVDEIGFWLTSRIQSASLARIMRSRRHRRVSLLATTQHFSGDVSQEARACSPSIYVFRTTSPAALRVLEKDYQLNPEAVRRLGVGQHFLIPGA